MDLIENWEKIRTHFRKSFRSNFFVSVGSVDADNNPTVTPIGSLFLNRNSSGFYFEKYPEKLPNHAKLNKNICVLAVNSTTWFWIKSLLIGEFKNYPAVKLYGYLGERRKATNIEINRLKRRMRATKGMKGNKYLWGDMMYVRDITFTRAEKINLGKMTEKL
jgi:hypothetical protein